MSNLIPLISRLYLVSRLNIVSCCIGINQIKYWSQHNTWHSAVDPGFPLRGRQPHVGCQLPMQLYFIIFLCQNERIGTLVGCALVASLDPPMHWFMFIYMSWNGICLKPNSCLGTDSTLVCFEVFDQIAIHIGFLAKIKIILSLPVKIWQLITARHIHNKHNVNEPISAIQIQTGKQEKQADKQTARQKEKVVPIFFIQSSN